MTIITIGIDFAKNIFAAAIAEAVTRPHMRFVPIKEVHQQIILCLHRTRQGFVAERTASYNRLRRLISEFGTASQIRCLDITLLSGESTPMLLPGK